MKEASTPIQIKHTFQKHLGCYHPSIKFHEVWNTAKLKRKDNIFRKPLAAFIIVSVLASAIFLFPSAKGVIEGLFGINVIEKENNTQGSYAALLTINDKEYMWHGVIKNNEYTIKEKIGEVKKSVSPEVYPKDNYSSNMFEVGEKIYTTNEDTKVLIVERKDGSYYKLSEVQRNE